LSFTIEFEDPKRTKRSSKSSHVVCGKLRLGFVEGVVLLSTMVNHHYGYDFRNIFYFFQAAKKQIQVVNKKVNFVR